jgi:pectin methylesterase-like acyl-CoA thioesterase
MCIIIVCSKRGGMNKAVALAFIIVSLTSLCIINAQPSRATKTIVVPDDYPTISAAGGNASQGDTILVKRGVYYENSVIDKYLSLVGEDSKSIIVIGEGDVERGGHAVFTLAAECIQLSGFTIESLNYSSSSYYATGIIIEADNCAITGNSHS